MPFPIKAVWRASAVLLVATCAGVCQSDTSSATITFTPARGQMGAVVPGGGFRAITGAPYSAEQTTERVQTLADGTHITQTFQNIKMYRDSAGRTRTEHQFAIPPGATAAVNGPQFIEISDPVAGIVYTLQPQNHLAQRTAFSQPGLTKAVSGGVPALSLTPPPPPNTTETQGQTGTTRPHPEMVHEKLEMQTIEGMNAQGTRTTTTYPVGFMGNDRPITTVREVWMSPDLKIMVMSKTTDPRNGDSTTRLTNLVQAEPDPALFQVPADYTVEDAAQPIVVR